jgi:hypothetical protein
MVEESADAMREEKTLRMSIMVMVKIKNSEDEEEKMSHRSRQILYLRKSPAISLNLFFPTVASVRPSVDLRRRCSSRQFSTSRHISASRYFCFPPLLILLNPDARQTKDSLIELCGHKPWPPSPPLRYYS